ncbi:YdcF family protein [Legionella hackeliae]|nr:YdcF family protein [Legionella hackeliae]
MFLLTLLFIVSDGLSDKIHNSDVAIILGSKVNPDGTPSQRLAARLDKGIKLYQQGVVSYIIVSGGTGKEGINEAIAMKDYLVNHDIPAAHILMDKNGDNTRATAYNCTQLMRQYHFKSALIISQYFHITRTRLALQQCNISPIYNAHANYLEWRDGYSIVREVAGFYYYLLRYHSC